jgi:hypothetical protein
MRITTRAADWDVAHEWYGQVDQRRRSGGPRLTPVEARMSENNRCTTEAESKETQRVDAVCDPDKERMPRRIQNLILNSIKNYYNPVWLSLTRIDGGSSLWH